MDFQKLSNDIYQITLQSNGMAWRYVGYSRRMELLLCFAVQFLFGFVFSHMWHAYICVCPHICRIWVCMCAQVYMYMSGWAYTGLKPCWESSSIVLHYSFEWFSQLNPGLTVLINHPIKLNSGIHCLWAFQCGNWRQTAMHTWYLHGFWGSQV